MSGNLFYSGHKMSSLFQVMGEEISVWEFSFSNGGFLYSIVIIFSRLFSCVLSGPVSEIAIGVPTT